MELAVDYCGRGMPIVCLHGHPGTGRCMSVFADYLSPHFQIIAPDLRGYGRSRATQPFTMEQHLDDLSVLLDRLDQPCLLLGWSLGGILAMELALKHPAQIAGLVLVSTAARPAGRHPSISWQDNLLTGIAGVINWLIPGWSWNISTFGQRSLFRYLISQHSAQAYRYLAREGTPAFIQTSTLANRALNTALRQGYNRLGELHRISQPCLMLAAANDVHITPESSQETAVILPNCECRLYDNVAHLMPWEIGPQLCNDIGQWLQTHEFWQA
ncbi:alpha/beta hydrolase [Leptothoe sp. ISB3NOV94-8A]|uniref:Alpha/beta hydrolase n=1 Tax=Adonisia turfae CCMR0081 TaxID=2292702 RepID=A0A6M0RLM9_9CYAN|nr:alpha/beta hydrolase [Adonisia turfae]MDV3353692.1 alpha/beta hydrolase [Leptothoe sp. LEGE 181152]NEZ56673.1 alpha/beta hydrolase [Adonisia turfae CCMR0081]